MQFELSVATTLQNNNDVYTYETCSLNGVSLPRFKTTMMCIRMY